MSIESKEIKDLYEIYQNLQEGPMSGAIITSKEDNKKDKPIIIRLKNGGKKTIYPNHPDYKAYKNNERKFSGSGESRIRINPDGRSGESDISAKEDQSGTLTDQDKHDIAKEKAIEDAMLKSGKYKKVEKDGGEVLQKVKDPNPKDNKLDPTPTADPKEDAEKAKAAAEAEAKKAWLKKTRNSPAAKSGAFSDDQRWATYQKHRKWQKDNNRGEFRVKDDPNTPNNEAREAAKKAAFNRRNKRLTDKGLKPIVKKPEIKTDQASTDTTTTFDSNRVKDGNKNVVKKIITKNEEFDAYDLVLNYLLETNQVDTIEEANYVMTQMDESTIQGIVNEYA
tara:strand:- start:3 stop:1010 length:1008 start_codon:yes stop_codon:yes gene_type:complete